MKIHRFYLPDVSLADSLSVTKAELLHQWGKVLRFRAGQHIVLFNGKGTSRLYKLQSPSNSEAKLVCIGDAENKVPKKNIYLFWSLIKKDKNDWVLQKATELGVSHFVPLQADRSEKTGFNKERAERIVIEAAEQCGRSDIPEIHPVQTPQQALDEYKDSVTLYICEEGSGAAKLGADNLGVLIGPEGGWSDAEKQLFIDQNVQHLNLSNFTLRAETAAVASVIALNK